VVTLVVQVNGRLRDRLEVPVSITEDEAKEAALSSRRVAVHTDGKQIVRVIYVPGKLVNVVAK
jgi:leucyl-tRNA synthetase